MERFDGYARLTRGSLPPLAASVGSSSSFGVVHVTILPSLLAGRAVLGGSRTGQGYGSAKGFRVFRTGSTEPWRGDECRLRTPAALRPRWPRSTSRAPRSRRAWLGGPCGWPDGLCEFLRRPVNSTRRRHRCTARTVRCRDDEAWMDRRHLPREGRCVIDARSSAQRAWQGDPAVPNLVHGSECRSGGTV